MELAGTRCAFWLPKKNRFCANTQLNDSPFCGNHNSRPDGQWTPCPIDPSHSVLQENLEGHMKRCPLLKQVQSLTCQAFYRKGINGGRVEEEDEAVAPIIISRNDSTSCPLNDNPSSAMKREAVNRMPVQEFTKLIRRIESIHGSICSNIQDSHRLPKACDVWITKEIDRKLPFKEKHVIQQASILGNLEEIGVLKDCAKEKSGFNEPFEDNSGVSAVVEFGAGRGYLTQMLADCYGIKRVFLVERKAYKLKADRSLRQKESLTLERLRIDIEDLNLCAVESLQGVPFLATGKHLCGPATDLTLRCCLGKQYKQDETAKVINNLCLRGLAIATCCHHLCQWKHYINRKYMSNLGITKEEFHTITWFTSWAVDADHGTDLSDITECRSQLQLIGAEECGGIGNGVEEIIRNMKAAERAALGIICKEIIDMGRMMWLNEQGLETNLVKYVPPSISPENHLLVARNCNL